MKIDDLVMHKITGEIFTVESLTGDWAEVSDILKPVVKMTVKKSSLTILPQIEMKIESKEEKKATFADPTKPITVLIKDKENLCLLET